MVAGYIKDYDVGLVWTRDEMKPIGDKGTGYLAFADAFRAASFTFITLSLEREKNQHFKGPFSFLLF